MWVSCNWFRGRLKTCITVILIAQCFLVYFYLGFTSHPTSESQTKKPDKSTGSTPIQSPKVRQTQKNSVARPTARVTLTTVENDITTSRVEEGQSDVDFDNDVIELETSSLSPKRVAQSTNVFSTERISKTQSANDVKFSKLLQKYVRNAKHHLEPHSSHTNRASLLKDYVRQPTLGLNKTKSVLVSRSHRLTRYEQLRLLKYTHRNESKLRRWYGLKSKVLDQDSSLPLQVNNTNTQKPIKSLQEHSEHIRAKYSRNLTSHSKHNESIYSHKAQQQSIFDDFKLGVTTPDVFRLPKPSDVRGLFYRDQHGEIGCFKEGVPASRERPRHFGCLCKAGWHGRLCSIPNAAWYSEAAHYMDGVTPRNNTRRIINALAFNVEWELLEARLYELNDTVDLFMIFESNISNYGEPKPLRLGERLRKGYLKPFHAKILYLFCEEFPDEGREDGWLIDQFQRTYIGTVGMRHVSGPKTDDIFIYTDADEIPSRETMLFLRIHDGYPEPFGFTLRWSVYGFFWRQLDTTQIMAGCTVGMLRYVYKYDAYELRSKANYRDKFSRETMTYLKTGAILYDWYLGDNGAYGGWHCSWCLSPDRIRIKLTSAINADFPRWGDYPEKLNLQYIRSLVKTGTWFDDKTKFGGLANPLNDPFYAPKHILKHNETYRNLINIEYV